MTTNQFINLAARTKAAAQKTGKPVYVRGFAGARHTRGTDWPLATLNKINLDIQMDYLEVIKRCRDLAKNSPIMRAYLSSCEKNIIGKTGFTLQCQVKKQDGTLEEKLNDDIEWAWYDFGKAMNSFLTIEGGMGHNDFDALILRTLLIDGEAFIRIHHPQSNPYALSFELIDSVRLDYTKRGDFSNGRAKVLGIEIDERYRPVKYYIRQGTVDVYQAGREEEVSASEIIHIYKKEFPQQVRGIPPFNACILPLKNIDDYTEAEILAAKAGSCIATYYEPTGQGVKGDFIDAQETNEKRRIHTEYFAIHGFCSA